MTRNNDAAQNNGEQRSTKSVLITGIPEAEVQCVLESIVTAEEIHGVDISVTVDENTSTVWENGGECPECGDESIVEMRGKEELYEYVDGGYEYRGNPNSVAAVESEVLLVMCDECSEVLWEHNANPFIEYNVL